MYIYLLHLLCCLLPQNSEQTPKQESLFVCICHGRNPSGALPIPQGKAAARSSRWAFESLCKSQSRPNYYPEQARQRVFSSISATCMFLLTNHSPNLKLFMFFFVIFLVFLCFRVVSG